MVLTQPRLSRAVWQAEVEKMRNTYRAPVNEKDVPAIADYLATLPRYDDPGRGDSGGRVALRIAADDGSLITSRL